jgi:hypothetical protein
VLNGQRACRPGVLRRLRLSHTGVSAGRGRDRGVCRVPVHATSVPADTSVSRQFPDPAPISGPRVGPVRGAPVVRRSRTAAGPQQREISCCCTADRLWRGRPRRERGSRDGCPSLLPRTPADGRPPRRPASAVSRKTPFSTGSGPAYHGWRHTYASYAASTIYSKVRRKGVKTPVKN